MGHDTALCATGCKDWITEVLGGMTTEKHIYLLVVTYACMA